MLKQQLDQDLKAALLAGEKERATVLRGLKSAILYEEVAKGARDEGLKDHEIILLLTKEAKKRQDTADIYLKGGEPDRADKELAEKAIIEAYLPKQLSDEELITIIDQVIRELGAAGAAAMGQVIGAVKQKAAGRADGGRIANLVRERLQ